MKLGVLRCPTHLLHGQPPGAEPAQQVAHRRHERRRAGE